MTSCLDRSFKGLGLVLVCVVSLSGCPQLLCDMGIADQCETYAVVYSANGADSGLVPVDERNYQPGDEVPVRANIGSLSLTGYSFTGWNTDSNGAGISYNGGDTFAMGSADITLFAEWLEDEDEATYTVTYHANGASSGSVPREQ